MNKKVISKVILAIMMITFLLSSYTGVYAVAADMTRDDSESVERLLKIIIVLITIILIMGVFIIRYIYEKYRLVIRFERREKEPDDEETKEEKTVEANNEKDSLKNDNVHIELDMSKLFAVMLIIVGIIIVVSIM